MSTERKDGDEYYRLFNRLYDEQERLHVERCNDPAKCVDDPMNPKDWIGCDQHIVNATERACGMVDAVAYSIQPREGAK